MQTFLSLFPRPGSAGLCAVFLTCLAFVAGRMRQELALSLLGVVFLAVLIYCFVAVFLTGLFYRKRVFLFKAEIVTKLVTAGGTGEIRILSDSRKLRFFRLPGTLIRYEMKLETEDERKLRCIFDPIRKHGNAESVLFPVEERGAYFGGGSTIVGGADAVDEFVIYDGPGFFRLTVPVKCDRLLLAAPPNAEEPVPLSVRSGGTEQRTEPHYRKTDDLTDHRPYVPGDDPRRINWKLYGHGPSAELFVREGEPEPPPRSRLAILLDTQVDADLFTIDEGRRAVDLLCSNALSVALEFSSRGMDVLIGYTGGKLLGGNAISVDSGSGIPPADLPAALAWPAAVPLGSAGDLPDTPGDRGVLILSLPRLSAESSALDRYLNRMPKGQRADIFFLYDAKNKKAAQLEESAAACVSFFNRKQGAAAHHAGL